MKCRACHQALVVASYVTKEYRDEAGHVYKTRRSPTYQTCPCRTVSTVRCKWCTARVKVRVDNGVRAMVYHAADHTAPRRGEPLCGGSGTTAFDI